MNLDNLSIEQTLPAISFDYQALKQWAQNILNKYDGLVVKEEDVKDIKADMAELNKAKQKLDRARIDTVKAISKPINEFEAQIKEVTAAFTACYNDLKAQVEHFEDVEQHKKGNKISMLIIEETERLIEQRPELKDADLDIIFQERWLNKTYSMKAVKEDIAAMLQKKAVDFDFAKMREERLQARRLLIEKTVLEGNKKYGLDKSVSAFMTPVFLNLEMSDDAAVEKVDTSLRHMKARSAPLLSVPEQLPGNVPPLVPDADEEARKAAVLAEEHAGDAVPRNPEASPEVPQGFMDAVQPLSQTEMDVIIRNATYWQMSITYPNDKADAVREIFRECQFMRIVRRLNSIGIKANIEKREA